MSRRRRVAIMAFPPRVPWAFEDLPAADGCGELVRVQAAMVAASSAPCIQAMLTAG